MYLMNKTSVVVTLLLPHHAFLNWLNEHSQHNLFQLRLRRFHPPLVCNSDQTVFGRPHSLARETILYVVWARFSFGIVWR